MTQALEGIRVLDLTTAYSGPIGAMQFADYGAEVIKVESTNGGDSSRTWSPVVNGVGVMYYGFNRNKKDISINLKTEEGRQMFYELVKQSDIVLENYRPGVTKKLGIDYETLKSVKEDIIMASLSGFGQTGPDATRGCYSAVAESVSGIMSLTGYKDRPPVASGTSFADSVTGLFMTIGVLMALHYREKTGKGQYIDVAMADAMLQLDEAAMIRTSVTGRTPQRAGNKNEALAPYDLFEAKDGYCFLSTSSGSDWTEFAKAIGREDLLDDPRFETNHSRFQNVDALSDYISDWTRTKTRSEIQEIFDAHHQLCAPLLSTEETFDHQQYIARDMIIDMDDPIIGKYKMPGLVIKMSETPGQIKTGAPVAGQDNEEIYASLLGKSKEEIAALKEKGII